MVAPSRRNLVPLKLILRPEKHPHVRTNVETWAGVRGMNRVLKRCRSRLRVGFKALWRPRRLISGWLIAGMATRSGAAAGSGAFPKLSRAFANPDTVVAIEVSHRSKARSPDNCAVVVGTIS